MPTRTPPLTFAVMLIRSQRRFIASGRAAPPPPRPLASPPMQAQA